MFMLRSRQDRVSLRHFSLANCNTEAQCCNEEQDI